VGQRQVDAAIGNGNFNPTGTKLLVEGNYIPKSKELLYFAYLDELSLVALETFIRSNISNFKGHGTGK
jgi:hypothetical protein